MEGKDLDNKLAEMGNQMLLKAIGHEAVVIRNCKTLSQWFNTLNLEEKIDLFHRKIKIDRLNYIRMKPIKTKGGD